MLVQTKTFNIQLYNKYTNINYSFKTLSKQVKNIYMWKLFMKRIHLFFINTTVPQQTILPQ